MFAGIVIFTLPCKVSTSFTAPKTACAGVIKRFAVTLAPTRTQGPNASKAIQTTEWDDTNDGIAYTIQNGHLTLAYTIDTKNVANTFNTQDMDGTYTATLTLTDLTSP